MAAEPRQPGRPGTDWEAAFEFWASLPDPDRTYQAVAGRFGVSVRTVERRGRENGWRDRLARIKAEAAISVDQRLAEERVAKLSEVEKLIDASWTTYAHRLRAGDVKVNPVDLPRLFALREQLWQQIAAEQDAINAKDKPDDAVEDAERRTLEIVRALDEAGAFARLYNLLHPAEPPPDALDGTEAELPENDAMQNDDPNQGDDDTEVAA